MLHLRVKAAQATVDAWLGRDFEWGRNDCFRLAAHTLRGMGHNVRLARFGRYSSEIGAAKALLSNGYRDVADVLDEMFPRIAPAMVLPADILGFRHPDQGQITGLSVHLGQNRILAFASDRICQVIAADLAAPGGEWFAWRADPCRF